MHGYQHTAVNSLATLGVCLPLYFTGYPATASCLATGLMIGTLLITPDLDLHLNDARRRWGPLKFIWAPYASLSRHRGMSHTYVLGPIIRIAYLGLWALPVLLILRALHLPWPEVLSPRFLALVFIGYLLAQWIHLLCDRILPFAPSRPRRSRRTR